MGCGNSKNKVNIIKVPGNKDGVDNIDKSPIKKPSSGRNRRPNSHQKRGHSGRSKRDELGSQDSLGGGSIRGDIRGGSATSKFSQHTMDSGFDDKDNRYIHEESDPLEVKNVEDEFHSPRDLDLGVTGRAVGQRLSAKDKERLDEQRVLASLREEGLITRPMSRAAGGVRFDVVQDNSDMFGVVNTGVMRPPARLAKLDKRRKKKRKPMTQAEIEAKLEKAEERRKEKEQERLAKIQAVTNKSDVNNALDSFMNMQKEKEEEEKQKVDQAVLNREKRLKEVRDKLRAKQEHAEEVRRRKKVAVIQIAESPQPVTSPRQRITEDTPVGKSVSFSQDYN